MEQDNLKQKRTVVTAFFDLDRGNWEYYFRDTVEYFRNAKKNLSLDENFIIFIETKYQYLVKNFRENFKNKTHIIVISKEELPKYSLREKIKNIMVSDEFKLGITCPIVPEMWNPDYDIITWSKTDLLRKAIKIDPFLSTHFCWLDFGIGDYAQIENFPKKFSNKIKLLCRSFPLEEDLNRVVMCKSQQNRFAAGFVTGSKDLLLWFADQVDEEITKCMNLWVVDCEQTMWSNVYLQNKDKFELYFGDWDRIITGYQIF